MIGFSGVNMLPFLLVFSNWVIFCKLSASTMIYGII